MIDPVFATLGLETENSGVLAGSQAIQATGPRLASRNPATGEVLAYAQAASPGDYEQVAEVAVKAFARWRSRPAPVRGALIRDLGDALRLQKQNLGRLVTLEAGKIRTEAEGEVQEMIDMCDYAVGLSRCLHGLTIASERPVHRLMEQWHPLGPVGIITAFNFPVAVWAWNATLAAVCGDSTIWKPSPITPLTAIAVTKIASQVAEAHECPGLFSLCLGETEIGERMVADPRLPLISATGSCRMGRRVAEVVGARLGRTLLELGGNNAVIVTPSANLDLALRAVVFAAVGTAGQRCTTLRRLIVHESIIDDLLARLGHAYKSVRIGDPADDSTLMGPLINEQAVASMMQALEQAAEQGGTIVTGGKRIDRPGWFVEPAIVRATGDMPIVAEETFAPILYVIPYRTLDEAIAIQNGVEQGLSSAIFTDRVTEAERFLSAEGSDCGIANVNLGTSGAEIGGAFGGEKATGGGREAGSDAWKAYMRRQTCTINGGSALPLAQGIRFEL